MPAVATRGDGAVSILHRMAEVLNTVVLGGVAVLTVAALHLYAATGFPAPGLVAK